MSDETDEEAPRSSSFFHSISRNFSYVVGLFFLIWLVLAKNIPSLLAPHNPAVVHKAEQPQLPQAEEEPQAAPAAPVVIERETVPDADTKHIANLEEQVATLKSEVIPMPPKWTKSSPNSRHVLMSCKAEAPINLPSSPHFLL